MNPIDIECPRCGRKPGFGCITKSVTGQWTAKTHSARLNAVEMLRAGKSHSYIASDGCEVTVTPEGYTFYNATDWW